MDSSALGQDVALLVSRMGLIFLEDAAALENWKATELRLLRIVCGFVAGMAFGLSRPAWRTVVVAEPWALSFLLFALLICLATCWIFAGGMFIVTNASTS